jgi:protein-L-isoaspartate(D-aspartate) O-methyltransferase
MQGLLARWATDAAPAHARQRARMVEEQVYARGIDDPGVIRAMLLIPRELFVAVDARDRAYADAVVPGVDGRVLARPFDVARQAASLRLLRTDRVLELGAGCGYLSALLASIASEVHTVEAHPGRAARWQLRAASLGLHNVHVVEGDPSRGLRDRAPFAAVIGNGVTIGPAVRDQLEPAARVLTA